MLGGATDVDLILVHLDFEAGREEGVEANDEVGMAFEEVGDTTDHSWRVDTGGGGGGGGAEGGGRGGEAAW